MQLDVEESTPASDITYWFHSIIAIWNCHHDTLKSWYHYRDLANGQKKNTMWSWTMLSLYPMIMPIARLKFCEDICLLAIYFQRYELTSSVEFWSSHLTQVTPDRWTENDAYESTMHKHRCAQKCAIKLPSSFYFIYFIFIYCILFITSALIVLSHNDWVVLALIVKKK